MHLLIAPANLPQSGFSLAVMHTLMQFIFSESYIRRVVVEPDIENKKIHRLNNRVGFIHIKPIEMTDKNAYLAICPRDAFFRAFEREVLPVSDVINGQHIAHLSPYYWEKANRFLLKKIISEFSHELIFQPVHLPSTDASDYYELVANGGLKYGFIARRLKMDHWLINSESLTRFVNDEREGWGEQWRQEGVPDVLEFLQAIRKLLDISAENFPLYLEEISSTLSGYCYKFSTPGRLASELCDANYQAVEMAMSEGHPIFVANNGRLGFDVNDFNSYAPEAGGGCI